jgi:hypothetical protein
MRPATVGTTSPGPQLRLKAPHDTVDVLLEGRERHRVGARCLHERGKMADTARSAWIATTSPVPRSA